MIQCKRCGDYHMLPDHRGCSAHTVVDENGDEYTVWAIDAEEAALKYAAEGDYYLMYDSVDITVDGDKYRISAEPDIEYSAVEL